MAVLIALVSSLCGGSADFIGGITSRRISAVVVVAVSQGLGLLVIAGLLLISRPTLTAWTPLVWAGLAGVCMTIGLTSFYSALSQGTMGVVAPLSALGALVPLLWGLFVLGETPVPVQGSGVALAVVGVVLTSGPERSGQFSARPAVLALISALAFGSMPAMIAEAATSSVLWTALIMKVGVGVSLAPFLRGARRQLHAAGKSYVSRMVVTIAIFDVAATILLTHALTLGLVSIVSVVASLYPVATVLLARIFLGEHLRAVQQVGVIVTFCGVGLIASV